MTSKAIIVVLLIALVGCTSRTEYGECIGAFDDKKPDLIYKLSARNLFWGIVGFSLIAPPIFVIVDQTFCPIGRKP
jgi:hypothetical protein